MLWNHLKLKMCDHLTAKIEEDDRTLSYAEVILHVTRLSKQLTGSCYAILCNSELNSAIALLACFAAHKTAIVLSPRYGEQHIQKILIKTHPEYLLNDASGELQIQKIGNPVQFNKRPAVILCTSGTSGTPKGVMLSEVNLRTNLFDIRTYFVLNEDDRILITRPLYHCAVITGEFLQALTAGAHIVFASKRLNPMQLIDCLVSQKITVLCGTPTLLALILRLLKGQTNRLSLKKVGVSGECLPEATVQMLLKNFPSAEIYHGYGLTEASPRVAYLPPNLLATRSTSAGFFLPSIEGKIVDADGKEVPDGTAGELLIKGDSIMMGYFEDPISTARVLSNGWLHTGDIAILSDGFLYIKGRMDNLINYAGMNIYPAEIENALKTDPRTHEVFAYGLPDKLSGMAIGLTIAGDFRSKQEVMDLCNRVLPSFSRPKYIDLVQSIPKNGSGKIMRTRIESI